MLHNSIPVAMYHHIAPTDRELNVFPENFEDHLRTLSRKGWKTLSGEEFLYFLEHPEDRPKKCILLTFDDGFADNYVYAYPLLKKYSMKAMIFVATGFIAEEDISRDSFKPLTHNAAWDIAYTERRAEVMCTWKELQEMEKSGAIDIQSHGMSHNMPDYFRAGKYDEIARDLSGGKGILEQRLSKKILHFAWPRGHNDAEGIRIAEKCGYRALYTTERGCNTIENLKALNRLPVKNRDSRWLMKNAVIYSSVLLTRLYLAIRTG
ncbi:MAG: hypothetical protein C4538_02415 [Nitrospiraceae bacterium]|nr:MAG: hypothetical protein C4538_02415 [Nitrospiraceae bacterium]